MIIDRSRGRIYDVIENISYNCCHCNRLNIAVHACLHSILRSLATKTGVNYHLLNVTRELPKVHARYVRDFTSYLLDDPRLIVSWYCGSQTLRGAIRKFAEKCY